MHIRKIMLLLLVVLLILPMGIGGAQDDDSAGAEIDFSGTVQSIAGTVIVVGGLTVDIAEITLEQELTVGTALEISGTLIDGVVYATSIVVSAADDSETETDTTDTPVPVTDAEVTAGGFLIAYGGSNYDGATDTTTFTYTVTGTGVPPDLSHFDIEIPTCDTALEVVAYSPADAVEFGVDPTTGIDGIKWDLPLGMNGSRVYTITFAGSVADGDVLAAVKGGNGFEAVTVSGASCVTPSVLIQKFVSADGGTTWEDASDLPGLDVPLSDQVSFRIVVTNDGNVDLNSLTLSDNLYDLNACTIPESLEPEATFDCVIGPFDVTPGQNVNRATVNARFGDPEAGGGLLIFGDNAYYFGGDRPEIDVRKYVAIDGGAFDEADDTPGVEVALGSEVSYRIEVINSGTVALSGITLDDPGYDLSACTIPESLEPEATFDCVIGPFTVDTEGQATNSVTATATAGDITVSDTDSANFFGGEIDESDLPVIIIIEGEIEAIDANVITIYDFEIELDTNDPLLTVLQIGDILRVEGELGSVTDSLTIVIIPINVIVVSVEIYIVDGIVWRDPGSCNNGPPPWAPAHGWRARCEGGGTTIIISGNDGMGMGMGMGMGN